MDNHKLVTIFIFFCFKNMKKMLIFVFLMKICLENFLGFDCMHEKK
jgi:hypothetical protein